MDDKSFLGSGMKFPPSINMTTGRFEVSSGEQSVKESVYLILMTQKNERWLRPGFGSEIMSYTFIDTNDTALNLMRRDITSTITMQEPRVSEVNVRIDAGSRPGCLYIDIDYVITGTNTRDNLVFPFYLNADTEEGSNADE